MAGSLAASVHAEASETPRWLISFARFVPFPSSPSQYPGLVPLGKSELSSSPDGTWLSTSISTTVYLTLVDEVNRSDVILSVELAGKILEERYISKLNFSWPDLTSVSGFPPLGSREILVSYMDSSNEIQKFALRFSTCDAAVTFVVALKEKLKGLEEAGLQERDTRSDTSFQSDTIPRAIVEEPNMVKHVGSNVPEMQPWLEYQTGQSLYPPQSTLSQIPSEPFSNLPPSLTTSLSGCFPNSTLDAGQTNVKQDPDLKSQILVLWTREEDEKLLHLAKLMPTQWRRIASIIGRASSQCLERYGKLIAPNPESKPACPEPVGLDENEKEMLSEARARLANTKGKMAKRRVREKQLEEVRRLASLLRKRKLDGIDYNAAIRFQKSAPANEDPPALPTGMEGLEAQLDVSRNKISQRQDAPAAILQANMMLNDPESTRKRQKMMLPSDNVLEGIPKMGDPTDLLAENEDLPNLARLTDSQTPSLGGENPDLHPSDFTGVTPGKEEIQMHDPMLSPSMTPGAAPRIGLTPSRDELHLNEDMDMHESEELMTAGDKTEPEAEEENAGKTLVTLKLLCHVKRLNMFYHETVDNIIRKEKRVTIEVESRRYEHDVDFSIVSISAFEVFEEEISPTLEAARQLFNCCCHCKDKPHLQRLRVGESLIFLLADTLVYFVTSDIAAFWPNVSCIAGREDRKIWTRITEDSKNKFECFTVEIWGSFWEVKRAFEESIVELRGNCFPFLPEFGDLFGRSKEPLKRALWS